MPPKYKMDMRLKNVIKQKNRLPIKNALNVNKYKKGKKYEVKLKDV